MPKFLNIVGDWYTIEDEVNSRTKLTHYCSGKKDEKDNFTEKEYALKCWFHPVKFTPDKKPACLACETEVPEKLVFMIKLKDDSGL